jgi:transposase-like protein
MDLFDFVSRLSSTDACIEYARELEFIARTPPNYTQCVRPSTQVKVAENIDGYRWQCPKCKRFKRNLRKESSFERSHLTLRQILTHTYLWVLQTKVTQMAG